MVEVKARIEHIWHAGGCGFKFMACAILHCVLKSSEPGVRASLGWSCKSKKKTYGKLQGKAEKLS